MQDITLEDLDLIWAEVCAVEGLMTLEELESHPDCLLYADQYEKDQYYFEKFAY